MRAIFVVILAFTLVVLVNSLDQEQIEAIDKLISEEYLPANKIPGVGLTVVHGADSLARGYGYRDLERGLLATSGTYFGVGSISKSFLALTVLRVLTTAFPELGESVLDVPIKELVPTYNFMSIDRYRTENVNFRDLLSHRVCTQPETWGILTGPYRDSAEFVYRQRYAEPLCMARTEFVYNNGLIQQAGEIAAHIAGTSFDNLLTQMLGDIGMTQTTFVRESSDLEGMTMLAKPYYLEGNDTKRYNVNMVKVVSVAPRSGGILTTPAEFVKYIRFHLNGGRVGSTQIIPEAVMKWMHKVANPIPGGIMFRSEESGSIYGDIGYGLCVNIGVFDGFQTISHGGYITPYLSFMTMVPALNIGILTTINGPGQFHVVHVTQNEVHAKILSILIDGVKASEGRTFPHLKAKSLTTGVASFWKSPKKPYVPAHLHANVRAPVARRTDDNVPHVVGIYGHPTSGVINVTQYNSSTLYMEYGNYAHAFLIQRGETELYDVVWDSDFPQIFYADAGDVPPVLIDFTDPLVAYIDTGIDEMRTPFYKDASLDTLPTQPWEEGSC